MAKKLQAKDGNGGVVDFEIDEQRHAQLTHFVQRNAPEIFSGFSARDANEALAFSVSQLAFVETTVFERQYTPKQYQQLLAGCIDYSAGEWAKTVEYEIQDMSGMGRRINEQADDIPLADISASRKVIPVAMGAIGYQYTTEDLRVSARLQRPLPTGKLMAAIEAYERHMNQVGLYGEAVSNLTGLFNNALVTAANRPSGAVWTAATAATILSDINAGIAAVWAATGYNTLPSRMVVAPTAYGYLISKARDTGTDDSILTYLLKNNLASAQGVPFSIVPGFGLDTAGAGSSKRAVFYNPGDDNIVMHIPMAVRFLAPQMRNLKINVPGEYKYAGVEVRRPLTMYYMDGL